jgi:hypothetical protein
MAGRTASEIKAAEMALRALKGEKAVAEMLSEPVGNAGGGGASKAVSNAQKAELNFVSRITDFNKLIKYDPNTNIAKKERLKRLRAEAIRRLNAGDLTRRQTLLWSSFAPNYKLKIKPTNVTKLGPALGAAAAAAKKNENEFGNSFKPPPVPTLRGVGRGVVGGLRARAALRKVNQPTIENVKRGIAGLQGNIAGMQKNSAQKEANELKAAMKRAENVRKAQNNERVSVVGPFFEGVEAKNERNKRARRVRRRRAGRGVVPAPRPAPPARPTVNTTVLTATLTRAIKSALVKKPKGGAPPPALNSRALASTLAASIKKALGSRKSTAGINTRGLTTALTAALKKALARQPAPAPAKAPAPLNTSALAGALARAVSGALAKRQPSAAQAPERKSNQKQGPEVPPAREVPAPKINKNSLVKSLTNALKRAFAVSAPPTARQTGGAGKPGAPGAPGKNGAPGPPGRNGAPGNRFQQRPIGGTTTTSVTGPTITGPTVTGPTVTGPTVTGPTITVGAPNIKIQLNGLVKATEQARTDPSKMANLERTVANLKAKLSNGSEAKKALNVLFPAKVNLGPATVPTPAEVKKVMNNAVVKEVTKKQAATQAYKPTTPPAGKSVKNMSFRELLAMRRTAKNRTEINRYLRQDVESELRKISRLSSSERGWRLGELYRSLPESLPARAVVLRAIQAEVRRVGRERDPVEAKRRLRDLYSNLGMGRSVPRELAREFKTQNMRALTNYKRQEERYARRYGGSLREGREMYRTMRPQGEVALMQRAPSAKPVVRELALRQGGARLVPSLKGPQIFAGPRPLAEGVSLKLPTGIPGPVLPSNQTAAINKAGGPTQALKVVAAVPGGAPAVARAAADLNEMGGNVKRAQELKGTPTAAIKAVQKLGGAKTASYALEGLNTLAQSKKTQVRKAKKTGRKVKKAPVRLHELNRVIEAVKRKKLVSLVSHNVANVNNSKKKKYYKKVIKSFILKKPLASKVQAAAKKNKS